MEEMIKLTKPTGEESYKILSAFKANEMNFIVLDSKLKDSNGNTITFIAQIEGNKLQVVEGETWDLVRNALITIVKGMDSDYKNKVPFEFINVASEYEASENVGHTLGLKDAHVSAINNQYKAFASNENAVEATTPVVEESVVDEQSATESAPSTEEVVTEPIQEEQSTPLDSAIDNANTAEIDVAAIVEAVNASETTENVESPVEEPTTEVVSEPVAQEVVAEPTQETIEETSVNPVVDIEPISTVNEPVIEAQPETESISATEEVVTEPVAADTPTSPEETIETTEAPVESTEETVEEKAEEVPVINIIDEVVNTPTSTVEQPEVAVVTDTPTTDVAPVEEPITEVISEPVVQEEASVETETPDVVESVTTEEVVSENNVGGMSAVFELTEKLGNIYNEFVSTGKELLETYKAMNEMFNKTYQNAQNVQESMNVQSDATPVAEETSEVTPENVIPMDPNVQADGGVQRTLAA